MNEKSAETRNGCRSVSDRLIEKLADARGIDPMELPPLGRAIDLEALDRLVDSANSALAVSFSVDGHDVTVGADGTVVLDSPSEVNASQ